MNLYLSLTLTVQLFENPIDLLHVCVQDMPIAMVMRDFLLLPFSLTFFFFFRIDYHKMICFKISCNLQKVTIRKHN